MKIDIRAISKDPGALMEVDILLDPVLAGLESKWFVFPESIRFKGIAKGISKGVIQLTGKVSAIAQSSCDRCLKETQVDIDDDLDVIFRSEGEHIRNQGFLADDVPEYDEEDFYRYSGYELILDKAIRDCVLLSLPGKVLCKEDCKGICNKCKIDKNENICTCDEKANRNNRFEELKKLL